MKINSQNYEIPSEILLRQVMPSCSSFSHILNGLNTKGKKGGGLLVQTSRRTQSIQSKTIISCYE